MSDAREKRIANDKDLVSVGRTLERLYGPEALDALVAWKQERTRKRWAKKAEESGRGDPAFLKCLFSEAAHEYEIVRDEPTCLEVKVTRCVHAEVFQSLNAADLGEKLICSGDDAVVAGFNPDMTLTRPSLLMNGGPCCHFIFETPAAES